MNRSARFINSRFLLAFAFCSPIVTTIGLDALDFRITKIAELKNYSTDEKRDIFNTFEMEDQKDQDLPIDPFDLMNRIKRAGAMNDATTPSDALDEALNAFDESEY